MQSTLSKTGLSEHIRLWWQELSEFPWRQMGSVLAERFRDARLGVSASSLTFTTVLALVPLFALGLAVFSAFPVFAKFQDTIQRWLIESLVPESIARQVLSYLTQFSRKASRLGTAGLAAVLLSAVFLMVTIERTLGQIWRVQRQRPLPQKVLLYWSA
ncbi:YihY family inner membrane protein, partial [uncultured Limnohabitans sp.]|uniref:YihY family inner membrane protein n=1 Tax=uncultured Limnohabitans sp. TaxID=768543 RepID=UPI00261D3070